jgi:hypothetical protein
LLSSAPKLTRNSSDSRFASSSANAAPAAAQGSSETTQCRTITLIAAGRPKVFIRCGSGFGLLCLIEALMPFCLLQASCPACPAILDRPELNRHPRPFEPTAHCAAANIPVPVATSGGLRRLLQLRVPVVGCEHLPSPVTAVCRTSSV